MIFKFKYSSALFKTLGIILCISFSKMLYGQSVIQPGLNDLTFFKKSSKTWQIVGSVQADLNKANTLYFTNGTGVLLNLPDHQQKGEDLYSLADYGDIDLELEY